MSETQTLLSLSREVRDEHRQIQSLLDDLSGELDKVSSAPSRAGQLRRLAEDVAALAETLRKHFEKEERGGLFEGILHVVPGAASELRHLGDQHVRLFELLDATRFQALCCESADIGPLRGDLEGFLAALRKHEDAEDALLDVALRRC